MPKVTLHDDVLQATLADLADAAKLCKSDGAVSSICTVVANLIANAGSYGNSSQQGVMDSASKLGFVCEFYPRMAIRVGWLFHGAGNGRTHP
jgi:hypothetical protein